MAEQTSKLQTSRPEYLGDELDDYNRDPEEFMKAQSEGRPMRERSSKTISRKYEINQATERAKSVVADVLSNLDPSKAQDWLQNTIGSKVSNWTPYQRLWNTIPQKAPWPWLNKVNDFNLMLQDIQKDTLTTLAELTWDVTVGPLTRTAEGLLTGKSQDLKDVIPGANSLSKLYGDEGYDELNQPIGGGELRPSDLVQIGQDLTTGVGAGKVALNVGKKLFSAPRVVAKELAEGVTAEKIVNSFKGSPMQKALSRFAPWALGSYIAGMPLRNIAESMNQGNDQPIIINVPDNKSDSIPDIPDKPKGVDPIPVPPKTLDPPPTTPPVDPNLEQNAYLKGLKEGLGRATATTIFSTAKAKAAPEQYGGAIGGVGDVKSKKKKKKSKKKKDAKSLKMSKITSTSKTDLAGAPTQEASARRK